MEKEQRRKTIKIEIVCVLFQILSTFDVDLSLNLDFCLLWRFLMLKNCKLFVFEKDLIYFRTIRQNVCVFVDRKLNITIVDTYCSNINTTQTQIKYLIKHASQSTILGLSTHKKPFPLPKLISIFYSSL